MPTKVTLNGQELFPARYFSGEDLKGKSYAVEIKDIVQEEMTNPRTKKQETKWVIYFMKPQRGAVLGKEFAQTIADALKETEAQLWRGKSIIIHPQQTRLGIGIRARAVATNHAEPAPEHVDTEEEEGEE